MIQVVKANVSLQFFNCKLLITKIIQKNRQRVITMNTKHTFCIVMHYRYNT